MTDRSIKIEKFAQTVKRPQPGNHTEIKQIFFLNDENIRINGGSIPVDNFGN